MRNETGRNILGAELYERFFIPSTLPIEEKHNAAPFLSWESSRFNSAILNLFKAVKSESVPVHEQNYWLRKIAEQVRTYWGNVLKTHAQNLRNGKHRSIDANGTVNATMYAPEDTWRLQPLHKGGRNLLWVKREFDYEKDHLVIDNPDGRDYQLYLNTVVDSYPDRNVITEYEIRMTFGSGLNRDYIRDFTVSRSQYSHLSSAPGFWEKVRASLAEQKA